MAEQDRMPPIGRFAPVLSAFMELSTERQIGMTVGPIPASKIADYLERYRLPYWWEAVIARADSTVLGLYAQSVSKAA